MWSHVTSIFGRFGRTALATEPCASTDFSAATSAVPAPSDPTYSPPNSPVRNVIPPDAPELWPCPPSEQWMAKVTAMQASGMRYDDSIFACGIVGYYRPPRWLADFKEFYLSTFVPSVWKLDLPRPPDAPKRYPLRVVPARPERTLRGQPDARVNLPRRAHRAERGSEEM